MQKGAKAIGKYILLLLFLLCFGYVLHLHTVLSEYQTPVIYTTEEGFSVEAVSSLREEESIQELGVSFTAVGTVKNQLFSNADLERSTKGTLLFLDGNAGVLRACTGELFADDTTGCVISTQAAWELFGETELLGGEIVVNDVTYQVRGVFEDDSVLVFLPADTYAASLGASNETEESDEGMNAVEESDDGANALCYDQIVALPSSDVAAADRSNVLESFGLLSGLGDATEDCLVYLRTANVLTCLIPACGWLLLLVCGAYCLWCMRKKVVLVMLCAAVWALVLAAFFVIFQMKLSIPADFIPNTWSDFSFWGEKITAFCSGMKYLLFDDKSLVETFYFKMLLQLFGFVAAGMVLFVLVLMGFRSVWGNPQTSAWRNLRISAWGNPQTYEEEKDSAFGAPVMRLIAALIASCVVELLVVILFARKGVFLDGGRYLLYFWPYLLVGRFVVSRMEKRKN